MFRASQIVTEENENANKSYRQDQAPQQRLSVKVPSLVRLLSRSLSTGSLRKRNEDDYENQQLAPITVVREINGQEQDSPQPAPPPLPYRLTFKDMTVKYNQWSRHKTVCYWLGFNSNTVRVRIEIFQTGLRRLFINEQEVIRETVTSAEWSYHHLYTDSSENAAVIKVVVKEDSSVALYADDFLVENLRRSSCKIQGSPLPPFSAADVETLDQNEVS